MMVEACNKWTRGSTLKYKRDKSPFKSQEKHGREGSNGALSTGSSRNGYTNKKHRVIVGNIVGAGKVELTMFTVVKYFHASTYQHNCTKIEQQGPNNLRHAS